MTAFFITTAGLLILLKLSPFELAQGIAALIQHREPSMKKRILAVQKPKKLRGVSRILQESKQVLKDTNQMDKFSSLSVIALVLFCVGFSVAISLNNIYLIPILAVGLALLPFLFVLFSSAKYKKQLNEELESALSTITTSYLRSENFLNAVKENLQYMNPPVHDVFLRFIDRVESIDPDIISALESMKAEIDHSVFQEWVDAAILCQNDRNLKSTLPPTVAKLSKIRTISGELDLAMYRPIRTYLTMLALVAGIIIVVCIINANWAQYLLNTMLGKLVLAITALVTLLTLVRVIQLTRPIEYKR